MAPLPKRKHSSRRQGKRRSAIKLSIKKFNKCPNCGQLLKPHRACPKCGKYKNRQALTIKTKKDKKTKS